MVTPGDDEALQLTGLDIWSMNPSMRPLSISWNNEGKKIFELFIFIYFIGPKVNQKLLKNWAQKLDVLSIIIGKFQEAKRFSIKNKKINAP